MSWTNLFKRKGAQEKPAADAEGESPGEVDSDQTGTRQKAENDQRLLAAKEKHKNGRVAEAEAIYLDILKNDPNHAGARHMVGIVCLDRGQLAEAEQHIRQAIAVDNQQAVYYANLGNVLGAQNRPEEAYQCFQQALSLNPGHLGALSNATTALLSMGRAGEAKPLCLKILDIAPDDVGARQNLAAAHIEEHEISAAIAVLREGLEIQPNNPGLLVQLASALELGNQLDDALAVIEQAEALQPGHPRITLLSGLISRRLGNPDVAEQRLRQAITQGLPEEENAEAFNQLGLSLDAMGRSDEAFEAFERSNQVMGRFVGEQNTRGSAYLGDVATIKDYFSAEKITALAEIFATDDDSQPVFFVGFPRSGTTLMEQVLKAHPKLITTEESSPLAAVVREIRGSAGDYPRGLDRLTADDSARLRQYFYDCCRDILGELNDRQVVDKLPLNIVHLALAKLLFPRAKIIVALRDPRDACLSCFMQKFEINDAMANFLELRTTGLAYEAVMGLWLHYRTVLHDSWLEYRYENLVENFDETVRSVLDFIGVGWHEAIAGYRHAAKQRGISTPSYRDVTAPVHNRAIARWRRYEQHLAPVLPTLAPFVEAFGYEK